MRRFNIGLGLAAAVLIALAWLWPDGAERADHDLAETTASPSPSESPSAAETAESEEPSEPPLPPEPSAEKTPETRPGADAYTGPLGTRNRTGDDTVAFTFDDGPDPKWTPKVLAELRGRGVKATFCVIGAYAEAYPELIADIVHDGHTLCNHTWFHEMSLGTWTEPEIRANLQRTIDAIEKAAPGAAVEYFRHPGGQWTERAVKVAAELGMESLHWAVDPSDWDKDRTEATIKDDVCDKAGPGAIILLHDGGANQRHTLAALRSILDEFDKRGYVIGSL